MTAVKAPVDLYDSHYDRIDDEVYRAVRAETYGIDLGQESWITAPECDQFCDWLGIQAGERVLEVACGSGGIAARIAETRGVKVVGTDINALAIKAAKERPATSPRGGALEFMTADADGPLPFPDGSFDALLCNDAINHFKDRPGLFREWGRVLRPGGRCLFSDPVVMSGFVSNAELAVRSSIGYFTFSVPGANEAALEAAGFRVERVADLTESVAQVSRKRHAAREKRRAALVPLETEAKYEGIQRFLELVHTLSSERRLSRLVVIARREAGSHEAGR